MIHLDTSFLIRGLVQGSAEDQKLRQWLRSGELFAMSTIAWAELLCGPLDAVHARLATAVVAERVPFEEHEAEVAAALFNHSGRRRGSLADCMIAATALVAEAPLATANPDDFAPLAKAGLRIVTATAS